METIMENSSTAKQLRNIILFYFSIILSVTIYIYINDYRFACVYDYILWLYTTCHLFVHFLEHDDLAMTKKALLSEI